MTAPPSSSVPTVDRTRVRGLRGDQRSLTVEEYFRSVPWTPSSHQALSQWSVEDFFARMLR